tara:strand:- start:512 stop:1204 length:693 start_codon:yes stop_codon:yes gene_type:complete
MIPEIITIAMSLATPKEKNLTPSLGQFLRNGYPINELSISRVTFFGDCPGEKISPAYKIGFLEKTSINLGEDKYRRVKVENMNTGGFTDRKYQNKGFSSQLFNVTLGSKHRGSFLTVQEGLNRFKWSVFNKKTKEVFVSGNSSLIVNINKSSKNRSYSNIREDIRCFAGERIYSYYTQRKKNEILSNCPKDIYVIETKGVCPDGREVTLTNEKVMPRNYGGKNQIIQNFY